MLTLILQIYIMAEDNRLVNISESYVTIKKLRSNALIPASIGQSLCLMLTSVSE